MTTPNLLSEHEAAEALRLCPRTLRKERQAGNLPYVLIGRRVLYAPDDLAVFIERSRQRTTHVAPKTSGRKVANRRGSNIVPFSMRPGGER